MMYIFSWKRKSGLTEVQKSQQLMKYQLGHWCLCIQKAHMNILYSNTNINSCLFDGNLCLLFAVPHLPLPPCLLHSPRSLYLHKGLFCAEPAPLLTSRWRDRHPILTGPLSHSPLL